MKFKVLSGTPLYGKIQEVINKIIECDKAAHALVERLGYKTHRGRNMVLGGGISSICTDGRPARGKWRKAGARYPDDEFMPAKVKANKELLEEIDALPVVHYDELNELINYDYRDHRCSHMIFCPAVVIGKDCLLIAFNFKCEEDIEAYEPVEGMIEITESEYRSLKDNS